MARQASAVLSIGKTPVTKGAKAAALSTKIDDLEREIAAELKEIAAHEKKLAGIRMRLRKARVLLAATEGRKSAR